ncbi:MAG TPA: tyrosine--tRNA ligase [Opitutaceae bacterium]|nr:tyrosine--tRNA ligase [Opitutaceae bacterium]
MTLLEDLRWRGLVADCTDETELATRLAADKKITLYSGFDPTSDSLHVGNLVPLLALGRFQKYGHHPIALAGGATGMIGDPSGKSAERNLQTPEQVAHNVHAIKNQLHRLLDFKNKTNPARLVDNATWTAPLTYLEFLRDIGKYFTVNWMMAKESVRARMEDRESGISYTEFSYMLLQAFDFFHLRKEFNCELQIGGSDQWGNITAGSDLCRKKLGAHVFGLTATLMTKADGTKYGKTAGGAIWLDPQKTSPYRFYQFFMQLEDADVIKITKMLSFADHDTIADLAHQHAKNPAGRAAHLALARELTTLVHGESACADAMRASEIMFGGNLDGVSEEVFKDVVGEVPTKDLEKAKLAGAGTPLTELLVHAGLAPSKGQARKDIEGGGIYLNNVRVAEASRTATASDLLFGKYILLRKGKRTYAVVNVV